MVYSIRQLSEPNQTRRLFKVALVEDQSELRKSWIKLINFFPEFACSSACATGEEALLKIPQEQPDVVLMDVNLPRMSGIECTVRLKELRPKMRVVMFTSMNDQKIVFQALEAGADGYLLKRTKPADLRIALLDVLRGGAPLTCQIARCVVESFRKQVQPPDETRRLSLKEERILMLVCQGQLNAQIAAKLGLSIHTVCEHLKRVFKKLEVSSRTAAAVRYIASKTERTNMNIPASRRSGPELV